MATVTELIEWGVAGRPIPGEAVSGDVHVVCGFPGGSLVGVIDGLGHGEAAAQASRLAVETISKHPSEDLSSLIQRCHRALQRTRGAALAVAAFTRDGTMTWADVGGLEVALILGDAGAMRRETLVSAAGVVGYQIPRLHPRTMRVSPGDTLVLATDGVKQGFTSELPVGLGVQQMADAILERFVTGTDDALVLVARYVGVPA